MVDELLSLFQDLGVFSSTYDIRVLTHLIFHHSPQSGKQISEDLKISDSRIYPSLNRLVELDLIVKDDSTRPSLYYLSPPDRLVSYSQSTIRTKITSYQDSLEKCTDLINTAWNSTHPVSTKFSSIYRDNEIITEITSLASLTTPKLMFILGRNAKLYLDAIGKVIHELLARDIQIELSMPHSKEFIDVFEELLVNYSANIILKQSKLILESYIIIGKDILFAIIHQNIADIAYYSEDGELIRNARQLWKDPNTSIQFHRLIRTE